jgi:hypothetical protein
MKHKHKKCVTPTKKCSTFKHLLYFDLCTAIFSASRLSNIITPFESVFKLNMNIDIEKCRFCRGQVKRLLDFRISWVFFSRIINCQRNSVKTYSDRNYSNEKIPQKLTKYKYELLITSMCFYEIKIRHFLIAKNYLNQILANFFVSQIVELINC